MTTHRTAPSADDEPLSAGGILDAAIDNLDLPKRDGRPLDDWAASLAGKEAQRFGGEVVNRARVGDYAGVRHYAHQAETEHRKGEKRPKSASEV